MPRTRKFCQCRRICACGCRRASASTKALTARSARLRCRACGSREPTLGEAVVVIGLGLIGQLAVQLLRANGCRVYGIDPDAHRVELARTLGADAGGESGADAKQKILDWTRGRGADAVVITAGTPSNEPIELAGEVSRLKGRVVAVGAVGMDVPRDIYFKRELTLKVSMSYGPGRYDPAYEERGHDYPFAYVRWTEARNIEAFLDLIAAGCVDVKRLTTHRFAIDEGARAYQLITGDDRRALRRRAARIRRRTRETAAESSSPPHARNCATRGSLGRPRQASASG